MQRKLATAIAILLLASTASVGAGPSANKTNDTSDDHAHAEGVTLDPAGIHEHVQEGDAVSLPTVDGAIEVEPTARLQETIEFTTADDEQVVRAPHVWKIDPAETEGEGLLLSFNHTLRAWVQTPSATTFIEPIEDEPGPDVDERYQVTGQPSGSANTSDGDVGTESHIQVYRPIYAYVDTTYRDQYGSCCWADQISYILGLSNQMFDDVELEYYYDAGEVDPGFSSVSMDDAWNRLIGKSWNGADVRTHWSFKDFDGCEVGQAALPGWTFLIQHQSDTCHLDQRPSTDAQRAYLTAREMGKTNDAWPEDHWSETTVTGHEHRSVMDPDVWGHYHECWSQTNLDAMASYLGTQVTESPC